MSTNTTHSTTARTSSHAKLRWQQRAETSELSIREAWSEGYYVGLSTHRGKARLHPPTNTLILERDGELITVLRAAYTPYQADHLITCERCSLQFQPSADDRQCPWCHYSNEKSTHE